MSPTTIHHSCPFSASLHHLLDWCDSFHLGMIFVRVVAHYTPLQLPYKAPFHVVRCSANSFSIVNFLLSFFFHCNDVYSGHVSQQPSCFKGEIQGSLLMVVYDFSFTVHLVVDLFFLHVWQQFGLLFPLAKSVLFSLFSFLSHRHSCWVSGQNLDSQTPPISKSCRKFQWFMCNGSEKVSYMWCCLQRKRGDYEIHKYNFDCQHAHSQSVK